MPDHIENPDLTEKKKTVKERLANGEYRRTFADIIIDGPGTIIHRLGLTDSLDGVTIWLSGAVIALLTILLGYLTQYLPGGESLTFYKRNLLLWGASLGALALIFQRVLAVMNHSVLRENIVDAIELREDLDSVEQHLVGHTEWRLQAGISLVIGVLLGFLSASIVQSRSQEMYGTGLYVVAIVVGWQLMAPFVIFLRSFYLSTQFGKYQFEVYDLDPSSSKIIDGIWDIITSVVFTVVLFIVILTSGLVYFDLLDSRVWPLLILIAWVPTVTFFVSGQSAISRIITRAKWNILDDIQAKVEALYSNEDRSIGTSSEERIPTPDTLDHLIKLMDYHDRIKNTPNSALNIRAGLTFINSLLLPVIASVIANTNALIGVFQ